MWFLSQCIMLYLLAIYKKYYHRRNMEKFQHEALIWTILQWLKESNCLFYNYFEFFVSIMQYNKIIYWNRTTMPSIFVTKSAFVTCLATFPWMVWFTWRYWKQKWWMLIISPWSFSPPFHAHPLTYKPSSAWNYCRLHSLNSDGD